MAKISNLSVIQAAVIDVVENVGCSLDEYIEPEEVYHCITMIYVNNDTQSGLGQDYSQGISVVASRTRISIIGDGAMSFYKNDGPICKYDDLVEDITQIVMVMNAAIDRWLYNLS
jgi:hypothetical protein